MMDWTPPPPLACSTDSCTNAEMKDNPGMRIEDLLRKETAVEG